MTSPGKPVGQGGSNGDQPPFLHLLGEGLSSSLRRPIRILAVERQLVERSSHRIERVWLTLDSGERFPVIFKQLSPGEKLYGNEREVLVYQRLLDQQRFGAPALYASLYDQAGGRYWLFLEDLGEQTLKGDLEEWRAAVRWMARMHGTYLGREAELRSLRCLAEHGPEYYHRIARAARQNLEWAGARRARARLDRLLAPFDSVVVELACLPRTLLHGDMFPKNLFLQPGPRIRPIDWESAAIGVGVWDLARLLDGWGEDRPVFLAAYLDELAGHTAAPWDRQQWASAFGLCDLLNILWHLRWDAEACRNASFVNGLLDEMETFWRRRRAGGKHG